MSAYKPTLATVNAKLDQVLAALAGHTRKAQYTVREFAQIIGISEKSLAKRSYWKRYGGVKRGKRVFFPESARKSLEGIV